MKKSYNLYLIRLIFVEKMIFQELIYRKVKTKSFKLSKNQLTKFRIFTFI